MAFVFAYSLDGNYANIIKDMPLDTAANFPVADQKKGTLVNQVSGLVRKMGAASGTAVGVLEGGEFTGLAGAPYAATNSSFTAEHVATNKYPNGVGKVRQDKSSVYRVPVFQGGATQTATNAHIGNVYAINLTAGDQCVDLNVTATPSVKVVDRTPDGKTLFVTLV